MTRDPGQQAAALPVRAQFLDTVESVVRNERRTAMIVPTPPPLC